MHLIIENKTKIEIFVSIIQLLKIWSSNISIFFENDKIFINTMDRSHVCLANIEIKNTWFSKYDCSINNKISVDSVNFGILMNYAIKHDKLELKFDEENVDKLYVNFLDETENSFEHLFEINVLDIEEDILAIPEVNYDVEFLIESKKFAEVLSELNIFGKELNIKCSETIIELKTNEDSSKLTVNIPVNNLDEYSITEGYDTDISFSLSHLFKMCLSVKISKMINVKLSKEYPMLLTYNLGDSSNVSFFIAPKV